MRIAYVINSLEGGGAAAAVCPVAASLAAQGCEVRIIALTPRNCLGRPAIEAAGFPVVVRQGPENNYLGTLHWLRREIAECRPDLIWTSLTRATLLGQFVGQMLGIDVVSWQHNAYLKRANRLLLRLRQQHSLLWVADSNDVADLTRRRLGVEDERLATWPLFAADAHAPQARPWARGMPVRIGSLGRLHPNKGYDVLIAALAKLREAHPDLPPLEVEIAGEGSSRETLEAQARQAGLDAIRFIGFVEARPFLASLHLYVQPSRAEGLCIAGHEAMQAGLPVIASTAGELPSSIVPGKTGLVVQSGDAHGLATALAELLTAPERLSDMGTAARQHVLDQFGSERFAARGSAIMQRLRDLRASRAARGKSWISRDAWGASQQQSIAAVELETHR